jgi:hypothetical protein
MLVEHRLQQAVIDSPKSVSILAAMLSLKAASNLTILSPTLLVHFECLITDTMA